MGFVVMGWWMICVPCAINLCQIALNTHIETHLLIHKRTRTCPAVSCATLREQRIQSKVETVELKGECNNRNPKHRSHSQAILTSHPRFINNFQTKTRETPLWHIFTLCSYLCDTTKYTKAHKWKGSRPWIVVSWIVVFFMILTQRIVPKSFAASPNCYSRISDRIESCSLAVIHSLFWQNSFDPRSTILFTNWNGNMETIESNLIYCICTYIHSYTSDGKKTYWNGDVDETSWLHIPSCYKGTAAWLTVPEPVSTRSGQDQMGGPNLREIVWNSARDDDALAI